MGSEPSDDLRRVGEACNSLVLYLYPIPQLQSTATSKRTVTELAPQPPTASRIPPRSSSAVGPQTRVCRSAFRSSWLRGEDEVSLAVAARLEGELGGWSPPPSLRERL